jgi:hypothetical protein
MARRTTDRDRSWRPLADLLGSEPGRLRERIEQLDLPEAERALVLDRLARRER